MTKSLPKWCFASIAKHFIDLRQSLPMFVEGQHRDTNKYTDYSEVRIDGPYCVESSRDYWTIDVVINILVGSTINDRDAYRYLKNSGIVLEAFTPNIKVFKLGTEVEDDGTLLGCLYLKGTGRDSIIVTHSGLNKETKGIRYSEVEGSYQMVLT